MRSRNCVLPDCTGECFYLSVVLPYSQYLISSCYNSLRPHHPNPLQIPFNIRRFKESVVLEGTRRYELGGAGPAGPESATRRARRQRGGEVSVATVYKDINVHRAADYWDYDNLQVPWG